MSVVLKSAVILFRWGLILGVLVLVTAATVGLPRSLVQRIEDRLTNDAFVVELGRVRFNVLKGVYVNHLKLFRRRALGPAILDAERMAIHFNLLNGILKKPVVGKVSMGGGGFRLLMIESRDSSTYRPHVGDFEIGVELDDFAVEGVTLNDFTARLLSRDGVWSCRSVDTIVRLGDREGQIAGDVEYADEEEFALQLKFECDPGILLPFMEASRMHVSSEIVRRFTFSSVPPTWTLDVTRHREKDPGMVTAVDFRMEDLTYRGVPLELADGGLQISSSVSSNVTVAENFFLVRQEELFQGGFTYITAPDRTNITYEATSTFHPHALTAIVGVWTNLENEIYEFRPPFKIDVVGNSDIGPRFGSHATFGMSFGTLSVGRIDVENCAFTYHFDGNTNFLENLTGEWCGGALTGKMAVQFPDDVQTNKIFNLTAKVVDAGFENVVGSIFDAPTRDSGGKLSGNVTIERLTDSANKATMRGHGDLRITDGQLLRLQVFGGLSDYVARMIPGVDVLLSQTDFKSAFEIKNDIIHSDKALLEGNLLSLNGKGDYRLDGTLDFNVQLEFLKSHTLIHGIISVPMLLFSKLFEFKLSGTRDDPKWYPINLSSSLFERLRGGGDKKKAFEETPE